MCYVGKATKIFMGVVAVLLAVGLVLGLGFFRQGFQRAPHRCDAGGSGCATGPRPDYPEPISSTPASSSPPPNSSSLNGSTTSSPVPPPLQSFPIPPPAASIPPATSTVPVPPTTPIEPTSAPPPPQSPPVVPASTAAPPAISRPSPVLLRRDQAPFCGPTGAAAPCRPPK